MGTWRSVPSKFAAKLPLLCVCIYIYIHTYTYTFISSNALFHISIAFIFICTAICSINTAILILTECQFHVFQRFMSSKLVLKTVESCFVALNYYEDGSTDWLLRDALSRRRADSGRRDNFVTRNKLFGARLALP